MTTAAEEVREGSSPADEHEPESTAEPRAHARASAPPGFPASLKAVTLRALASAGTALDRPGSLVHAQPPTFRQARDHHHECAGHFQAGLMRWPRYAWGYLHLLVIMPALYLAVWVTESPARFTVTVAVIAAIWYWS